MTVSRLLFIAAAVVFAFATVGVAASVPLVPLGLMLLAIGFAA